MSKDLTELHQKIIEIIKQAFPAMETVQAYNPLMQNDCITTPSVLIEVTEIEQNRSKTGGRLTLDLSITAHVCLGAGTVNLAVNLRNTAVRLMQVIKINEKWGLDYVTAAKNISALPGMFSPLDNGFDSWAVSWIQTIEIGTLDDGKVDLPEGGASFSEAPNIGLSHIQDYEKVKPKAASVH